MKSKTPPDWSAFPEVVDLAQACALLQLSKPTVAKLCKESAIPHRRVGREYRFNRETLKRWVDGNQAA